MMGSITLAEYEPIGPAFGFSIACPKPHRPGRMILISGFVILDKSVGTVNRGAQVLGIARHLVQAEIAVPILTNNMRLKVVLPKLAPAGVSFAPGFADAYGTCDQA